MDSRLIYHSLSARMTEIERDAERRREVREAMGEADRGRWSLRGWLRRSRPEPVAEPAPVPSAPAQAESVAAIAADLPAEAPAQAPRIAA